VVFAVARYARGHVIRPIRIVCALAIGGVGAAVLALAGIGVPRAFLAMTACLALAFSVNRRPARPPRWPALGRAGWIIAAALMLAAMPADVPRESGAFAFAIGGVELALVAAVLLLLLAAIVRLTQGVRADPGDRLLVGVLGGIVAFVALVVTSLPPPAAGWIYLFCVLLGAGLARANGNLRAP
jgi:hypothetical protein